MRSISLFFAILFAFAATSYAWPEADFPTLDARKDGNNTKSNNPKKMLKKTCRKLSKLGRITTLAANQTKLDEWLAKGMLTPAKVENIKAKAANATAELKTLQSNTTLVGECAVVNADFETKKQCQQMKQLKKLTMLANNETAMAEFEARRGLNGTFIEKLKEKIADASTSLQEMQANTTLVDFCKQRQEKNEAGQASQPNTGASGPAQPATGSASTFNLQTMPYIFVPAVAAVFTLFL